METLDIKGFPVETHIAGSGPPLLYLHAEQYFEQVRPHLDALAKNWRVIAPRHPGYGAASGATDLRSVDDLAYLYLDLLDELKLDNVVLVGASFGGWIALEMCVRNRARLSKLVLVSSVGVKFSGREERDFADLFYMPDIEHFRCFSPTGSDMRRATQRCPPASWRNSRASATCSPTMVGDHTCTIRA